MNLIHIISKIIICFILNFSVGSDLFFLNTNGSTIIGRKLHTVFEKKPFVAFWRIAYAEPPELNLRFKPPILRSWSDRVIGNYTVPYPETCASGRTEDCLHLSIYMPISDHIPDFPVIVWFYDTSHCHGPDFLIDENVIVVTVSFRTAIFGFLNSGDDFAAGNMGAKDMLASLRWIRTNIDLFKGDIKRVTVVGTGTAANVVAAFLLSPAAEDLFARVVIQSGSAVSPADYRNYNFEILNKLYWNLNSPFEKFNRTKLYEILANASMNKLLLASEELFDSTEVRDNQRLINSLGPTVELRARNNDFMNKLPLDVYKRRRQNNNVEVMIGYTSLESLHKLAGFINNRKLLKYLNYNFQYLLPFEGRKDEFGSQRYKRIRQKIMDFYFLNGTLSERSLRRYAKYVSDQIIYPVLRQAKLHAETSCCNVYLYRFSYKGCLNVVWHSILRNLNFTGATSGDEICYQFRCKSVNDMYDSNEAFSEKQFIKEIARLLANFAKYGNPTPKASDGVLGKLTWKPLIHNVNMRGLNLGRTLKMIYVPEEKRMRFWDQLKEEFFTEN